MHGAGFSIAPIFMQSAWFRFHNQSEELKNLYFCGAGTHPGAGVPGVLSSAKIVEKLVPPPRALDPDSDFEVFRSKSRTFSLASFLLPRKRMRGIAQLYFICRSLDDWADESNPSDLLGERGLSLPKEPKSDLRRPWRTLGKIQSPSQPKRHAWTQPGWVPSPSWAAPFSSSLPCLSLSVYQGNQTRIEK